jgi:cytochrome c peroxidase
LPSSSGSAAWSRAPLFTDFGYAALAVPRNPAIPANRDPGYFDLGLCGPRRHDLSKQDRYCGMFKTPTLRNVALKQSFFHNGAVHALRKAVAFYAERDTVPRKWYPTRQYDDLPPGYAVNVTQDVPFGPVRTLSDTDVDDITAFLRTLTDGYSGVGKAGG